MINRDDIAHEEMTSNPIFLLQRRWVYPNQDCLADYDNDAGTMIDPDTKEIIDDDQLLERGWATAVWQAVTVFATRGEATEFGDKTNYRYGRGRKNIDWQVYCIPCTGELVKILKEYYERNADNSETNLMCLCGHPQSEHGSMGVCLHVSNCKCVDFKPFRKVES